MMEPDACDEIRNYGQPLSMTTSQTKISQSYSSRFNNTNDLNVQRKEQRNSSRLADFVRYTFNGNGEWKDKAHMFHELFSRDTLNRGTPKEETML